MAKPKKEVTSSVELETKEIVNEKPSTNTTVALVVAISLMLFTAVFAYSKQQNSDKSVTPTPSVTASITVTPTQSVILTPSVTTTVTPTATPANSATITGTLSYPGEMIPPMSVCAVKISDKSEVCVTTKINQFSYEIKVPAGTYWIYALAKQDTATKGIKSYYTKCDTYDDSFIPECNPTATGNPNDSGKWNKPGFICYEDTVCKAAFTPLSITVAAKEKKALKRMMQGWYIPCSRGETVCNSASFDVWSDYLPK